MKYRLLDFLVCPHCGGTFTMKVLSEEKRDQITVSSGVKCGSWCSFYGVSLNEDQGVIECGMCYRVEIRDGLLECSCGSLFPVVDYIPRILPDAFHGLHDFLEKYGHLVLSEKIERQREGKGVESFRRIQGKTKRSFAYEWLRYNVELEKEDREVFLGDSQLSKEDFKDKVILDAGCGMGRYTKVVGIMGREVVGVDISQSVVKAYLVTHDNPSIHILQGNILHLPFREKQFDIIYSLGVLHHTPNAKQSFLNLVRYLKHGGFISVWVYGTTGNFSDFKTNPLRKERQHYVKNDIVKRMHWRMVYVREVFFNTIRLVTTRMYVPLLYLLCYPLAVLGRVPLLKYVTASVHQSWRVRVQENFDWLSPQYQSHHTKEEIRDWFREAQVEELSILPHGFIPKVGLKGKLR